MSLVDTSVAPSDASEFAGQNAEDPSIGTGQGGDVTDLETIRAQAQADRFSRVANAHPWMPPAATIGLVTSSLPTDALDAAGHALRQAATAMDNVSAPNIPGVTSSFAHIFNDPVLQKQPTTATAVYSWLSQAIGPPPISEVDIANTQAKLAKDGYAQGLNVNGVWGPEWQSAFRSAFAQAQTDQLAGKQFASKPVGGVLHWLTSVLPKEAGNAVLGFIKSVPHDVRQLMADTVGGIVDMGAISADVTSRAVAPFHPLNIDNHAAMATAGGFVMGQTPAQYARHLGSPDGTMAHVGYAHMAGRLVEDIGTLFVLNSLWKAGGSVAMAAAKDAAAEGATGAAGASEGGIASRAGQAFRATGPGRQAAVGDLGLTDAYRGPGVIARTIGRGVDLGDAKFLQNVPVLGRVGPWVAQLNDADGLYYRARTLMATPYAYMPVRVAGQAAGSLGTVGAEARGVAAAANKLDPNNPLSQNVEGTRYLDAVDDAMRNRLSFTVLGKRMNPAIDDLAFLLHPTPGTAAAHVGGQAGDLLNAFDRVLGPDTSVAAQIERGTGQKLSALQAAADNDQEGFTRFWSDKVMAHAAAHYADRQLSLPGNDVGEPFSEPWINASRNYEHAALEDPQIMAGALREMLSNPGELAARIRKEVSNSRLDPLAFQSKGIENFIPASKLMREEVVPFRMALLGQWGIDNPDVQLGLARKETVTSNQAKAAASGFSDRLNALNDQVKAASDSTKMAAESGTPATPGVNFGLYQTLDKELGDYLFTHFGIDGRSMPQGPEGKIAVLERRAGQLASDAHVNTDELPAHLQRALGKLDDLGYKPVLGNDIGWRYQDNPAMDVTSNTLTWRRKAAGVLGIDPTRVPTHNIGLYRYLSIRDEIQNLADTGKITLPPYYTADTVLHDLRDANLLDYTGPSLKGAIARLRGVPGRQAIADSTDALAASADGAGREYASLRREVEGRFMDELQMGLQLRDIPRKRIIEVLTQLRTPGYDVESGLQRLARNRAAAPGAWLDGADADVAEPMDAGYLRGLMDPTHGLRTTPEEQAALTHSVLKEGFASPVTLGYNPDTGQAMLKDGYHRMQAAQEAGLSHVPTKVEIDRGLEGVPMPEAAELGRVHNGDTISPTRLFGDANQPDPYIEPLPAFSKAHADRIFRAIVKGSAAPPGYMLGMSKLEDLFRASLGIAGEAIPGDFGERIANLPNNLVRLRDNLRFDLNPEFAARRVAKTNLKMGLEGVDPTLNPVKKMLAGGTLDSDRGLLDRLLPNQFSKSNEEVERLLRDNDIFGLYSHRDYQAYAAGQWSRQGLDDDEIKDRLVRTFSYGDMNGAEGRSALERSVNFMFFPFSFDKTLYRNLGSYLLDRPAQLLVTSAGLSAYDAFSKAHPNSPLAGAWLAKHLPVLKEFEKMNALAHGVSLGEPGGINRPLLNFFLPQLVSAADPNASAVLKRVLPAYKGFTDVWKELVEQGQIVSTGIGNTWDRVVEGKQEKGPFGDVYHPAETAAAQITDGQLYFQRLASTFTPYLKWNDAHKDSPDSLYRLPAGDPRFGKYAGSEINKTMLRDLVHDKYPAYNPDAAAEFGVKSESASRHYLQSIAGTPVHDQAAQLLDYAKKYGNAVASGKFDNDPAAARQATLVIRTVATRLATQDSQFLKLWDRYFASYLGPLERSPE